MKPTVGRIVHVRKRDYNSVAAKFGEVSEALAAIVTRVWSETCINVQVFPHEHGSTPYAVTSVCRDDADEPLNCVSWRWPPRE